MFLLINLISASLNTNFNICFKSKFRVLVPVFHFVPGLFRSSENFRKLNNGRFNVRSPDSEFLRIQYQPGQLAPGATKLGGSARLEVKGADKKPLVES